MIMENINFENSLFKIESKHEYIFTKVEERFVNFLLKPILPKSATNFIEVKCKDKPFSGLRRCEEMVRMSETRSRI